MSYIRQVVKEGSNLQRMSRGGDGAMSAFVGYTFNTDAVNAILPAQIIGGLYIRGGLTVARTDTVPTAAQLDTIFDGMDVGDTFELKVSVQVAFALTLGASAGCTVTGKATVPASGLGTFLITKLGASSYNFFGL